MVKIKILSVISLCMFLTACSSTSTKYTSDNEEQPLQSVETEQNTTSQAELPTQEEAMEINYEQIDNCIYMLNEYLRDEFSTEYYDTADEIKQAIFEEENSTEDIPAKLIGMDEEIPTGFYGDPIERIYYPIYNFDDFNSVMKHFSEYFSENAMEKITVPLSYNFLDFEETLYLVRGARGYGAIALDFDSVEYSQLEDEGVVLVDELLFGEKYGTYKLNFIYEDGKWKIDSFEETVMNN